MVVLWAGCSRRSAWVIVAGLTHFDPALAFDIPPTRWTLDGRFAFGLGAALAIAMYDFLGYYQVCYLGDEVAEPARTIPRAILISVVAVALDLPDDEREHPRRHPLARGDRVGAHRQRPDGRLHGPVAARCVTADDPLDRHDVDLRRRARLQPRPVRRGPLGPLLPGPGRGPTRPATSPTARCSWSAACRRSPAWPTSRRSSRRC